MPVYKDKERGTYYVKINTTDPVTNKPKQIMKRGFKLKRDAVLWESEHTAVSAPTSITFMDMLNLYLKDSDSSEFTKHRRTYYAERYFSIYKDRPINTIKRSDLVEWRNSLADYDIQNRTRNQIIASIKAVFRFANSIYLVEDVSVVLKPFKRGRDEKREMQVWTPDEFNQFLEAIELKEYALFFEFLYWTGCRRGEAIALQYTDFKDGTVSITKSMKHNKNGFLPLKTESSERTIMLDHALSAHLEPNLANCNEDRPFVFGGATSLSISQIQRYFSKAIKASGVKPIRIHDLRHSHATWLINNGVNIVAVSKRLGHSTINQTLQTYTHLLKQTEEDVIKLIDENRIKNVSQKQKTA